MGHFCPPGSGSTDPIESGSATLDAGRHSSKTTEYRYKSTDSVFTSFKCNELRESLSVVDSQNIPCATLKRRGSWIISVYLWPKCKKSRRCVVRFFYLYQQQKDAKKEKKLLKKIDRLLTFKKIEILWFQQGRLSGEDSYGLGQGFLSRFGRQDGRLLRLRAQAPLQGSWHNTILKKKK